MRISADMILQIVLIHVYTFFLFFRIGRSLFRVEGVQSTTKNSRQERNKYKALIYQKPQNQNTRDQSQIEKHCTTEKQQNMLWTPKNQQPKNRKHWCCHIQSCRKNQKNVSSRRSIPQPQPPRCQNTKTTAKDTLLDSNTNK